MAINNKTTLVQTVQTYFDSFLNQGGSRLRNAVTNMDFTGDEFVKRKMGVGAATLSPYQTAVANRDNSGISYEARVCRPYEIRNSVQLDMNTMYSQNNFEIDKYAQDLARTCGEKLDELIIKAMLETSTRKTETSTEEVSLPASSIISRTTGDDLANPTGVKAVSLNVAKVLEAARMLRAAGNNRPVICIADSVGLSQLKQDTRMASSDYNILHSLVSPEAQNSVPYGGIDYFIECEQIPVFSGAGNGANAGDKRAIVFAMDKIFLGCQAGRHFNIDIRETDALDGEPRIICKGYYSALRYEEDSVVQIPYEA